MVPTPRSRFMSWRDLIITPAVEAGLMGISFLTLRTLQNRFHFDSFVSVTLFFAIQSTYCVLILNGLRRFLPDYFREGTFGTDTHPRRTYYAFNLYGFLLTTNLGPFFFAVMLPPVLRKSFYQCLGAKFGGGIVSIGGRISDPHLAQISRSVMIGDGALLLGHTFNTLRGKDVITFGKICIEEGAVIGAHAIILPGVTIGRNAMVTAMSLVSTGTVIKDNEIWGGVPAKPLNARPLATTQRKAA
jgi:acetyltransferase-like isoleucine patch superfamily enzyme